MPAVDISVSDNDGWQDANNLDLKLSGQGKKRKLCNKLDCHCKTPFFSTLFLAESFWENKIRKF